VVKISNTGHYFRLEKWFTVLEQQAGDVSGEAAQPGAGSRRVLRGTHAGSVRADFAIVFRGCRAASHGGLVWLLQPAHEDWDADGKEGKGGRETQHYQARLCKQTGGGRRGRGSGRRRGGGCSEARLEDGVAAGYCEGKRKGARRRVVGGCCRFPGGSGLVGVKRQEGGGVGDQARIVREG
jgi:hypothetical protein